MESVEPEIVSVYQQKSDGTLAAIIPRAIREYLGIKKKDRFVAYVQDNKIVLKPISETTRKVEQEASV